MSKKFVHPSADKMGALHLPPDAVKGLFGGLSLGQVNSNIKKVSKFRCPKCKTLLHYPNHSVLHEREEGRMFKKLLCGRCKYEDWQEWK